MDNFRPSGKVHNAAPMRWMWRTQCQRPATLSPSPSNDSSLIHSLKKINKQKTNTQTFISSMPVYCEWVRTLKKKTVENFFYHYKSLTWKYRSFYLINEHDFTVPLWVPLNSQPQKSRLLAYLKRIYGEQQLIAEVITYLFLLSYKYTKCHFHFYFYCNPASLAFFLLSLLCSAGAPVIVI